MAIEIAAQAKIKTPLRTIILLVIDCLLLVGLLTSYFYFSSSSKKITELLKKTPQEIFLEEQIKQKETALSLVETRINAFGKLLAEHQETVKILNFIEKVCLPNVWFSKFDFNASQQTIGISGQTDNFVNLWQQIDILKKEPMLKNVSLTSMGVAKEEGVDFFLSFQFDPLIFK